MKNFTKKYHKKMNCYSDLSNKESFELEKECLIRLKGFPHFPQIISSNQNNLTITMSHCGESLLNVSKIPLKKVQVKAQITEIVETLKNAGICHLDILMKNICYKNGRLYLIDFDIAVLDDTPMTQKLYNRYIKQDMTKKLERVLFPKILC